MASRKKVEFLKQVAAGKGDGSNGVPSITLLVREKVRKWGEKGGLWVKGEKNGGFGGDSGSWKGWNWGLAWFWVLEVDLWALDGSGFEAWKSQVLGPGRGGFWALEGDSGSWKGQILGPESVRFWGLEGDSGSWKGILGPGRVRFWGLVGVDCGSWKGIVGPGRGFWLVEGLDFGSWKGQFLGPGRGLWVLEGDCGSWKGILDHGRAGFWVLEGSGFGAW